jgi:hypothetical protein
VKNVLAIALVVSVASIALSQAPGPKTPEVFKTTEAKQKWEYTVSDLGSHASPSDLYKKLNEVAKDGWELDKIVSDRLYIFRRAVFLTSPIL